MDGLPFSAVIIAVLALALEPAILGTWHKVLVARLG